MAEKGLTEPLAMFRLLVEHANSVGTLVAQEASRASLRSAT
jgi:hypothetical protein